MNYAELEPHRAPTSRRAAPAARTRDRDRRRTGAASGSRLRRRARRWLIGTGSRSARRAQLRLAVARVRIESGRTAIGCAGFTTIIGIGRTQRRNPYGIVHTRLALRRANVDEATRLHVGCDAHAGAGHWREYGVVYRIQCLRLAAAAVARPGQFGRDSRRQSERRA